MVARHDSDDGLLGLESSDCLQCQFHGTVVRTIYLSMYLGAGKPVTQVLAGYEVIDAPPCILLSRLETV